MASEYNDLVNYINNKLGIQYTKEHWLFDKSNKTIGRVDYFWKLKNDSEILFEYEKEQAHPDTNVLKVWPYMENKPNTKIILIQYFENGSIQKMTNRMRLCIFLSEKLKSIYPGNFKYFMFFRNNFDFKNTIKELGNLRNWDY